MLIHLFLNAVQISRELLVKWSRFLSGVVLHKSVQFCAPLITLVIFICPGLLSEKLLSHPRRSLQQLLSDALHPSGANNAICWKLVDAIKKDQEIIIYIFSNQGFLLRAMDLILLSSF